MKISEIHINKSNPRFIKDERFKKLVTSIKDFPKMMSLRPIVIDAKGIILGGNMRYRAIKELGYKEIPDIWLKQADDLTEEERKRFIIEDNIPFGEWDYDILANEWDAEQLAEWGMELPDEWDASNAEAEEDDYEIPDEIETDIVLGDLFEIGNHRLLCGSSTDATAVKLLLNNSEPYLMITDPPYGVEYDASWRVKAGINKSMGRQGKVSNDNNADWTDAWVLSTSRVAYVWHAGKYASIVQKSLEDCDFDIRSQIIWVKDQFAMSRGDYHWKHEPCWYAVKKGNKGNWASDRKQTTVWNINRIDKGENGLGHSTQKPVECMAKPLKNHDGDVYDPFLGSGTTMVAAHQLNRKCYGMEIDPKYCQVIIDRMLKLDPALKIKKNGGYYVKIY